MQSGAISLVRGDIRHAVEPNSLVGIGHEWEEWASNYLLLNKIDNVLQSVKAPYDIIALGNVFIDVKVATKALKNDKYKSPRWSFHPNTNHNKADIYMLIIAPLEEVFIVPADKIENKLSASFCWPTKRPEIGKIQKYHNRLDLIWKVHHEKEEDNL